MSYNRVYPTKVNWMDYPSLDTPLCAQLLNKMDSGIHNIDAALVTLDASKANAADVYQAFVGFDIEDETGDIIMTRKDGTTVVKHTNLARIIDGFHYNTATQKIELTSVDGTVEYVDISSMISETEFIDSDTVAFTLTNHKVSATIKSGSITEDMLETGFLTNAQNAASAASAAQEAAEDAALSVLNKAEDSEAWAVGERDGVPVTSTDETYHNNSKHYSEQSDNAVGQIQSALSMADFDLDDDGNLVYTDNSQFVFNINEDGELLWELDTTALGTGVTIPNVSSRLNSIQSTAENALELAQSGSGGSGSSTLAQQAYNLAEQAFQSASDGKGLIATAITGKGGTASSSDTFATLANAITNLSTDSFRIIKARMYITDSTSQPDKYSGSISSFQPSDYDYIFVALDPGTNGFDVGSTASLMQNGASGYWSVYLRKPNDGSTATSVDVQMWEGSNGDSLLEVGNVDEGYEDFIVWIFAFNNMPETERLEGEESSSQ